jgi:hypothetical protein
MFFKKKNAEPDHPKEIEKNEILDINKGVTSVLPQIKKIKKPKPVWDSRYKVIDVQYPQELGEGRFKKKYKLNLTYKLDDKIHKKTIRFGKKDDQDFIDSGDITKKNRVANKLGNTHNMFHGNFWRLHLLNGETKSLRENYLNLISHI